MSEETKKPIYKKWWAWLIAVVVIGAIIGATSDGEKETADNGNNSNDNIEQNSNNNDDDSDDGSNNNQTENETNNNNNNEDASNGDDTLSEDEVESLKNSLEEALEGERDFDEIFYLEEFEYDEDSNRISARVDMQQDPLPDNKEDVEEWAETWSWSLAEATPDVDKPFHVTETLVTKTDDDEYILWGHSKYDHEKEEYTFKEESGMELYD